MKGDTLVAKATLPVAQGDTFPAQGDSFAPKVTVSAAKVTDLPTFTQGSVRCVNTPELSGSVAQTGIRPIRSIAPREIDLCLQRLADAEAVAVAQEALGRAGLARGSGDAGKVHGHVCVVERP